jgi:hypothetical protein
MRKGSAETPDTIHAACFQATLPTLQRIGNEGHRILVIGKTAMSGNRTRQTLLHILDDAILTTDDLS